MQTSCSYPELVHEELKKYDGEVCKYFQVDRKPSLVSWITGPVRVQTRQKEGLIHLWKKVVKGQQLQLLFYKNVFCFIDLTNFFL